MVKNAAISTSVAILSVSVADGSDRRIAGDLHTDGLSQSFLQFEDNYPELPSGLAEGLRFLEDVNDVEAQPLDPVENVFLGDGEINIDIGESAEPVEWSYFPTFTLTGNSFNKGIRLIPAAGEAMPVRAPVSEMSVSAPENASDRQLILISNTVGQTVWIDAHGMSRSPHIQVASPLTSYGSRTLTPRDDGQLSIRISTDEELQAAGKCSVNLLLNTYLTDRQGFLDSCRCTPTADPSIKAPSVQDYESIPCLAEEEGGSIDLLSEEQVIALRKIFNFWAAQPGIETRNHFSEAYNQKCGQKSSFCNMKQGLDSIEQILSDNNESEGKTCLNKKTKAFLQSNSPQCGISDARNLLDSPSFREILREVLWEAHAGRLDLSHPKYLHLKEWVLSNGQRSNVDYSIDNSIYGISGTTVEKEVSYPPETSPFSEVYNSICMCSAHEMDKRNRTVLGFFPKEIIYAKSTHTHSHPPPPPSPEKETENPLKGTEAALQPLESLTSKDKDNSPKAISFFSMRSSIGSNFPSPHSINPNQIVTPTTSFISTHEERNPTVIPLFLNKGPSPKIALIDSDGQQIFTQTDAPEESRDAQEIPSSSFMSFESNDGQPIQSRVFGSSINFVEMKSKMTGVGHAKIILPNINKDEHSFVEKSTKVTNHLDAFLESGSSVKSIHTHKSLSNAPSAPAMNFLGIATSANDEPRKKLTSVPASFLQIEVEVRHEILPHAFTDLSSSVEGNGDEEDSQRKNMVVTSDQRIEDSTAHNAEMKKQRAELENHPDTKKKQTNNSHHLQEDDADFDSSIIKQDLKEQDQDDALRKSRNEQERKKQKARKDEEEKKRVHELEKQRALEIADENKKAEADRKENEKRRKEFAADEENRKKDTANRERMESHLSKESSAEQHHITTTVGTASNPDKSKDDQKKKSTVGTKNTDPNVEVVEVVVSKPVNLGSPQVDEVDEEDLDESAKKTLTSSNTDIDSPSSLKTISVTLTKPTEVVDGALMSDEDRKAFTEYNPLHEVIETYEKNKSASGRSAATIMSGEVSAVDNVEGDSSNAFSMMLSLEKGPPYLPLPEKIDNFRSVGLPSEGTISLLQNLDEGKKKNDGKQHLKQKNDYGHYDKPTGNLYVPPPDLPDESETDETVEAKPILNGNTINSASVATPHPHFPIELIEILDGSRGMLPPSSGGIRFMPKILSRFSDVEQSDIKKEMDTYKKVKHTLGEREGNKDTYQSCLNSKPKESSSDWSPLNMLSKIFSSPPVHAKKDMLTRRIVGRDGVVDDDDTDYPCSFADVLDLLTDPALVQYFRAKLGLYPAFSDMFFTYKKKGSIQDDQLLEKLQDMEKKHGTIYRDICEPLCSAPSTSKSFELLGLKTRVSKGRETLHDLLENEGVWDLGRSVKGLTSLMKSIEINALENMRRRNCLPGSGRSSLATRRHDLPTGKKYKPGTITGTTSSFAKEKNELQRYIHSLDHISFTGVEAGSCGEIKQAYDHVVLGIWNTIDTHAKYHDIHSIFPPTEKKARF